MGDIKENKTTGEVSILDRVKVLNAPELKVSVFKDKPFYYTLLTSEVGLGNTIEGVEISRPQLVLAGLSEFFNYKQVQLFGKSEVLYLNSLSREERIKAFQRVVEFGVPCIIVANEKVLDDELLRLSEERGVPIFMAKGNTTQTFGLVYAFLSDYFAEQASVHGTLVDVLGIGIMFIGKSGIGKSEIALDLVERGHRLVADDHVILTKKGGGVLMATSSNIAQHFMEIRGLGFVNIKELFGRRAVRHQKRLEIIVELVAPNTDDDKNKSDDSEVLRHGLDEQKRSILGVEVKYIKIPVYPGRNIAVIAEAIAINYLAKEYGYDAAKVFSEKQKEAIMRRTDPTKVFEDQRTVSWFQYDEE